MNRYEITEELRESIKNSGYSMRELTRILGFTMKNIMSYNISIREDHWLKLKNFLHLGMDLQGIEFPYEKNFGDYNTQPVKKFNKGADLAEIFGIILGDGNIYNNNIKIAFDKRNSPYIMYVFNLFYKIFGIHMGFYAVKDSNAAYLYHCNKNITPKLIDLGLCHGDKIKWKVGIPQWIKENPEYSQRCIKGLVDTDGCIYKCKREKQLYVKFTCWNQQLMSDFKEVNLILGYHFAKSNKRNVCLYRKLEVATFINRLKPFKAIHGAVG